MPVPLEPALGAPAVLAVVPAAPVPPVEFGAVALVPAVGLPVPAADGGEPALLPAAEDPLAGAVELAPIPAFEVGEGEPAPAD
jgi:hypothetical protein